MLEDPTWRPKLFHSKGPMQGKEEQFPLSTVPIRRNWSLDEEGGSMETTHHGGGTVNGNEGSGHPYNFEAGVFASMGIGKGILDSRWNVNHGKGNSSLAPPPPPSTPTQFLSSIPSQSNQSQSYLLGHGSYDPPNSKMSPFPSLSGSNHSTDFMSSSPPGLCQSPGSLNYLSQQSSTGPNSPNPSHRNLSTISIRRSSSLMERGDHHNKSAWTSRPL